MKDEPVVIRIMRSTREKLKKLGKYEDTYDSIINKLIGKK